MGELLRSLTWKRVVVVEVAWLASLTGAFVAGVLAIVRPWSLADNVSLRSLGVALTPPRVVFLVVLLSWPLLAGAVVLRLRR
jgi:hypothetical protein